jgi:hypothetical protein
LEDAIVGEKLNKFQRKIKVSKNPAAAALFFDIMITNFLKVFLRWNGKTYLPGDGFFGKCKGYYGMAEAQGKGTLHLHLLVWLEGHLSPQTMRIKMAEDVQFKNKIFS